MYIDVPIAKMKIGRISRNGVMSSKVIKMSFTKKAVLSKRRSMSNTLTHINMSIIETRTLFAERVGHDISPSVIIVMNPFDKYMKRSTY